MTVFSPDRRYLPASLVAVALAAGGLWSALSYQSSFLPAVFCGLMALAFAVLARLPAVRTSDQALEFGSQRIPWPEIVRADSTRWTSPLVLRLTRRSGRQQRLVYSGSAEDCDLLLRRIRRLASNAFIDGIPHRQYWGLSAPIRAREAAANPDRGRLLPQQDEAEVEQLFQELRSKGRLERGR